MDTKKYYTTWTDVKHCVTYIAKDIKSKYPVLKNPVIVPIVRGGLCLGTCLSHKLKTVYPSINVPVIPVSFQTRDFQINDSEKLKKIIDDYNEIFITEDLVDSGQTLKIMDQVIAINYQNYKNIEFYALFGKKKSIHLKTNYWKDIEEDTWYVFPWEME